jgi:hypothetical protein
MVAAMGSDSALALVWALELALNWALVMDLQSPPVTKLGLA